MGLILEREELPHFSFRPVAYGKRWLKVSDETRLQMPGRTGQALQHLPSTCCCCSHDDISNHRVKHLGLNEALEDAIYH